MGFIKPRVAVTGANGFIGQSVVEELKLCNVETVSLVRRLDKVVQDSNSGHISRVWEGLREGADYNGLFEGCSAVVHCAARVHVLHETASNPDALFDEMNALCTIALAKQAISDGVSTFVFISTIGVLGDSTQGTSFSLDTEANPHNAYARSKLKAEVALQKLGKESGMNIVIIRPPLVYGPNAPGNFAKLAGLIQKGIPLPFAGVKNKRAFVSIRNLANAIVFAVLNPSKVTQPVVITDGENISTAELMKRIIKASNASTKLIYCPSFLLKLLFILLGKRTMATQLLGDLEVDHKSFQKHMSWHANTTMSDVLSEIYKK